MIALDKMQAAFEVAYPAASRARRGDDYGGGFGSMFVVWQADVASCAPVQAQGEGRGQGGGETASNPAQTRMDAHSDPGAELAQGELPPLPQFFALGKTRIDGEEHGHYSAKQMQDYARAALDQAKPVAREQEAVAYMQRYNSWGSDPNHKNDEFAERFWSKWEPISKSSGEAMLHNKKHFAERYWAFEVYPLYSAPPAAPAPVLTDAKDLVEGYEGAKVEVDPTGLSATLHIYYVNEGCAESAKEAIERMTGNAGGEGAK